MSQERERGAGVGGAEGLYCQRYVFFGQFVIPFIGHIVVMESLSLCSPHPPAYFFFGLRKLKQIKNKEEKKNIHHNGNNNKGQARPGQVVSGRSVNQVLWRTFWQLY